MNMNITQEQIMKNLGIKQSFLDIIQKRAKVLRAKANLIKDNDQLDIYIKKFFDVSRNYDEKSQQPYDPELKNMELVEKKQFLCELVVELANMDFVFFIKTRKDPKLSCGFFE